MTKRRCRDCPKLIPSDSYKGRCPDCNRRRDQTRGSREERGYGAAHQQQRAAYAQAIQDGHTITCWRCGQPILDLDDLHLGHDDNDRSITRGPEHARKCNLSAAGRASHRS